MVAHRVSGRVRREREVMRVRAERVLRGEVGRSWHPVSGGQGDAMMQIARSGVFEETS